MGTISADFHYGGSFSRDWLISYTGGDVKRFEGLDPGKFSFFELCGYVEEEPKVKKGGYRLWWMPHYEVNFRVVKVDEDVSEIKEYVLKVNKAVNIFVEHDVDEINGLVDIPNYVTVTNREVGQSSQVEVNGEGLEKEKVDNKGKGVLVCSEEDKHKILKDMHNILRQLKFKVVRDLQVVCWGVSKLNQSRRRENLLRVFLNSTHQNMYTLQNNHPNHLLHFMRTNPLAPTQTQTVIEPSASIHTTVQTGRNSQTIET